MKAVDGEDGRLVPEGVVSGNPAPHFPIEDEADLGEKTAEVLIDVSTDGKRRKLNTLLNGELLIPILEHACRLTVERRDRHFFSL